MFDNDELYQFQVGGGYKTCEMLRKPIETCSKQRTYPSAVSNTVRSLIGNHPSASLKNNHPNTSIVTSDIKDFINRAQTTNTL